jgi:RHH-type rel operon transcriptional repressor/antitoxin RelB
MLFIIFMSKTGTVTLSCTIPAELGEQLSLLADVEERSKSYYVKKALQEFLSERLEDALLSKIGDKAYKEYLESGEEGIPYDQIRKELKLDKHS